MIALFSLLSFIFLGLLVAIIAKGVMPGRDPGVAVTILLGTISSVVASFVARAIGWERYGQPWQFFLSIGVAVVLLHMYRESGMDDKLAQRTAQAEKRAIAERAMARPAQSLAVRAALAPVWACVGALMLGVTGFLIGFFGPMKFQPWANQGPMVGIFFTGPAGLLLGGLVGGVLKIARPDWSMRRLLWALNAATVVYGLVVLDLVADRSWWR
jgi:uncharacterized membrane protein YeaQ/YmgE (transglycosylase-associated protein family)